MENRFGRIIGRINNMDSQPKELFPRREFLRKAAVAGGALLLPSWLLTACDFGTKTSSTPTASVSNKEKSNVPNLDLKIDEAGFWKTVRAGGSFQLLPDATDKSKLLPFSPGIYLGKSGILFRVGINRSMADFFIRQSKLIDPSLRTNIAFIEDWGPGDMTSGEGGFTGIDKNETEQNIIIWLKRAAWQAFKTADKQGLSVQDYYQGFISFFASSWMAHELAHAGAETKTLWKKGQQIPQAQFDATHPQIFAFQKQYEGLYDLAGKQGLAANALLVGIEPTVDLDSLRTELNQEAKQKGFE